MISICFLKVTGLYLNILRKGSEFDCIVEILLLASKFRRVPYFLCYKRIFLAGPLCRKTDFAQKSRPLCRKTLILLKIKTTMPQDSDFAQKSRPLCHKTLILPKNQDHMQQDSDLPKKSKPCSSENQRIRFGMTSQLLCLQAKAR